MTTVQHVRSVPCQLASPRKTCLKFTQIFKDYSLVKGQPRCDRPFKRNTPVPWTLWRETIPPRSDSR